MVRTVRAFLEFCYLVRRNVIDEQALAQIQDALERFYRYRKVFLESHVVTTFSLPRQHSMKHYSDMIRMFGAPNGLCSSITESKHIKAIKEPYRRSNRNQPLGQMLLTNQRLDKLTAARSDFTARGMLDSHILVDTERVGNGTQFKMIMCLAIDEQTTKLMDTHSKTSRLLHPKIEKMHPLKKTMELQNQSMWTQLPLRPVSVWRTLFVSVHGHSSRPHASTVYIERKRAHNIFQLSDELCLPNLSTLISHFLLEQSPIRSCDNPDDPNYPRYDGKIGVFNSASAMFYAPSDVSGIHGMRREFIRSTPLWRNKAPRYDCAFVNVNPDTEPMKGLEVV